MKRTKTRSVVRIAIWVYILCACVAVGGSIALTIADPQKHGWKVPAFILWFALCGAILVISTRPRAKSSVYKPWLCHRCGHHLVTLHRGGCPACGHEI